MFQGPIAKLNYQLCQMSLRERAVITLLAVLCVFFVWDLLFFETQKVLKLTLSESATYSQKQLQTYQHEITRIQQTVARTETAALIKKYQLLSTELQAMQARSQHYRKKNITSKQLVNLINGMFENLKGVTLESFESRLALNQKLSGTQNKGAVEKKTGTAFERRYYHLRMQGDYFSILAYLKRIERLPWLLYWDKFEYQVKDYPLAIATLTFHIMSSLDEQ